MRHILRVLNHVKRETSFSRAILFGLAITILLLVLLIKGVNIFIPFTYLAF
jgi:hypothetical protein